MPRETKPFGARSVIHHPVMHQFTVTLDAESHIRRLDVCLELDEACYLHFWHSDQDLIRATAVTRAGTDTEIRVSTNS